MPMCSSRKKSKLRCVLCARKVCAYTMQAGNPLSQVLPIYAPRESFVIHNALRTNSEARVAKGEWYHQQL